MTISESHSSGQATATGPLMVSAANPRYFTVASGDAAGRKAVYLTGSHIWNNFHDGMGPGADCAETAGAVRLRRVPRVPRATTATTSSGSGAGSSSSRRPPAATSTCA